jgi:nitric oxide dioxygenase
MCVLESLGKRHYRYGVRSTHYTAVGEALIFTLATALGDDFTDDVKAEWLKLYTVVSDTMQKGAALVAESA